MARDKILPNPTSLEQLLRHLNSEHENQIGYLYNPLLDEPMSIERAHQELHDSSEYAMGSPTVSHNHPKIGHVMSWKKRYSGKERQSYPISYDLDSKEIVAHMLAAHGPNWTNHDEMVNEIRSLGETKQGRWDLHNIHEFFHRKGNFMDQINHDHPEEEET